MPELAVQSLEEIESESLVRLRLITHNARLVDARKQYGMTQPEMAQATGIHWFRVHRIETMKVVPHEDEMIKIACVLEKPIDYLFPEHLLSAIEVGVFSRRKVDLDAPQVISLTEAQHLRLLSDGGLEEVERKLLTESIDDVLQTLASREQFVLRQRFGFDGQDKTQKEVGRELGLTAAQIYQIEHKALRKLRHPSRSRMLKDYLG